MKNKELFLNQLYNDISNIKNIKINIYIEEIKENQLEYYYFNRIVHKYNEHFGVRIDMEFSENSYSESFDFVNYNEAKNRIYIFINKYVDYQSLTLKPKKIMFKRIKKKYRFLSNSKKYQICENVKRKINYAHDFKLSFYEKKENLFILNNQKEFIFNIKNFYSKIMLHTIYNGVKSFDQMLFNRGYTNLNATKINDFIEKYNYNNFIKHNSKPLVDGNYDLIFSNKCGTVFHEMFGHNLEHDLIDSLDKKIFIKGSNIGNKLITYIDDPKFLNLLNVSYNCYGDNRNKKVLIKDGTVIDFLINDSLRSENYKYHPTSRMSNTYLKPIKNFSKLDIDKLKKVIYIKKIKNGRLYLEKQKFKIEIDCAILYENGKVTSYISNISFIVDVFDFISKIKYIGDDLDFVPTVCGAKSGNIFVFAGCPTTFVTDINIIQNN